MKNTFGKIGLGLAGAVAAVGLMSAGVQTASAEVVISLSQANTNPSLLAPNDYQWAYNLTFDGTVNKGDSFIMTGFSSSDWISGSGNSVALDSTDWTFAQVTGVTIPTYHGTQVNGSLQTNVQGLEVTYTGTSPIVVSNPISTTLLLTDTLDSQNIDTYWWKLSDENSSGGNSGDGNAIMPAAVNITGQPLPLPAAFWPGLLTLGGMAVVGGLRMRRRTV